MSASANDPRQPSAAKPYVPPPISPQDLPVDYSGFVALVFGITGVMLRYKLCSWLAIIFCAQSLVNMKNIETDLKHISMAMMFAIMGLVSNYMSASRSKLKLFITLPVKIHQTLQNNNLGLQQNNVVGGLLEETIRFHLPLHRNEPPEHLQLLGHVPLPAAMKGLLREARSAGVERLLRPFSVLLRGLEAPGSGASVAEAHGHGDWRGGTRKETPFFSFR
ncbi:hypothetical protein H6P81_019963 [Aristolochia fimbriata]|uniref:Protein Asterix n=1 Tax=Aristolochia fimbriata TaxID=158543 RepID=A0AAV7DU44_ARIFI|nr:hypothetical protein H6P81_019963 [Aristolochia fimbriata]